jgi:ABC-type lipoprotein export system ATPase subunit
VKTKSELLNYEFCLAQPSSTQLAVMFQNSHTVQSNKLRNLKLKQADRLAIQQFYPLTVEATTYIIQADLMA